MIQATVERMYTETEENRFLEVTYANGDKEVLYFKDFNSGAMIQNIVDRAKKMAIKDFLDHDQQGLRVSHLLQACVDEFKENEDLPNTTNPDDWARISGKKGERIVFIRTLITGKQGTEPGRSIDTVVQHRPVPLTCPMAAAARSSSGPSVEARARTRRELGPRYDRRAGRRLRRAHRASRRRASRATSCGSRRAAGDRRARPWPRAARARHRLSASPASRRDRAQPGSPADAAVDARRACVLVRRGRHRGRQRRARRRASRVGRVSRAHR